MNDWCTLKRRRHEPHNVLIVFFCLFSNFFFFLLPYVCVCEGSFLEYMYTCEGGEYTVEDKENDGD